MHACGKSRELTYALCRRNGDRTAGKGEAEKGKGGSECDYSYVAASCVEWLMAS